jgi:ribosomal protein L29
MAELKGELLNLRVQKITSGSAAKVTRMSVLEITSFREGPVF